MCRAGSNECHGGMTADDDKYADFDEANQLYRPFVTACWCFTETSH